MQMTHKSIFLLEFVKLENSLSEVHYWMCKNDPTFNSNIYFQEQCAWCSRYSIVQYSTTFSAVRNHK